jgi:hypothetical protein
MKKMNHVGRSVYNDALVEITDDFIRLKRFYFPFAISKRIPLQTIERIEVLKPALATGKWRLWGSGDFQVWFPLDCRRYARDSIFYIHVKDSSIRYGFTVLDSNQVSEILKSKNLIKHG